MKYQAKPVIVEAYKIVEVNSVTAPKLPFPCELTLDNGECVIATPEMLARMMPKPGDYWVIQEDGYIYLNPKEVFERKYAPVSMDMAKYLTKKESE